MATRKRAPGGGTGTRPSTRIGDAKAGGPTWTSDDMENVLSGMGGSKDKSTGMSFVFVPMDQAQLEAGYRSDWIARKVIDIPAQDATREWRSWQADKTDITAITDLEDEFSLRRKVKLALQRARLYGGAALILGVNQGKTMADELVPDRVRKGDLKFVHVVSRNQLQAQQIDWRIDSKYYGEPEFYQRTQGSAETIHPSRVVRFLGNPYPDDATAPDSWSDSVLQVVQQAIFHAGIVSGSVAQMVQESKLDVIGVPQLLDQMANADYMERLRKRWAAANVAKSVYSMLLLDKEEEWKRIEANFTGLPDILKMYLLIASGACDIPATRMLGQSPAGLSATGESDLRNYYDNVADDQDTDLRVAMERLDEVLVRSALGDAPEKLFYEWNSLWQLDDVQKATVSKSKADAHKIDVDAGLIPPEILRDARINQLIEDGTYPGLEQIVEDYGELDALDVPTEVPPNETPPAPPNGVAPNGPQQTGTEPAVGGKQAASNKQAAKDAARRARATTLDATPRTLYVRRDVVNADALLAWAKQNFDAGVLPGGLHVTICYSRMAVDWSKAGEAWGQDEQGRVRVAPGGMRVVEKLGNRIVLLLASSTLSYRHCDLKERTGASWDYEDYQPHISVALAEGLSMPEGNVDLTKVEPYRGEIVLGPEIFEETKP